MPNKPYLTTEKFIEKSKAIHGDKYSYELVEYISANKKVKIICLIHGIFEQKATGHMNNGYGCLQCARETDALLKKKDINLFIDQGHATHNRKYDYSKVVYKNNSTKIEIVCNTHGSFFQTPDDHLNSGAGCPKCARVISHMEVAWLDYLKVPEKYRHAQIKIENKFIKPDAYDPEINTIYEFYGDFWHGNPKIYDKTHINPVRHISYGDLYLQTLKKENLIKKSGYQLMTIWESEWKLHIQIPTPPNFFFPS